MATFNELIKQVNDHIKGTRDRGTAFEEIVVAYLKNEPTYHNKFSHVWMLNEVPDELGIPKKDTGVDIVAQDRITGGLTAVQAKFYTGKVGKDTINSFIAEFSKNYYEAGILVSTTDQWNRNAEQALEKLSKPMTRIGLSQLEHASINWQLFDFDQPNDHLRQKPKELRDYQQEAIDKSLSYFKQHDRGKLIMAPGTGKTFTSLKIAEALMKDQDKSNFNVLYLVPSIQLLSQTLFNWNDDHDEQIYMNSFSVVSDAKATKKKHGDDDLSAKDIGFPATTNVNQLMDNYQKIKSNTGKQMNVIFSTYQSIDVIHKAQEIGLPEFDLIVADEAHRTTGANEMGDPSVFTKVHSNKNVSSKLRLYQTATPKVYGVDAKKKAKEQSVVISSMDDEKTYGDVIFHLGFGDAVNRGYLTDYKVSVLAVSEQYVNKAMQETLASDNELKTDDPGKIIGVWNAMVKRNGLNGEIKGAPMKRAIAFTDTIAHSKEIAKEFNNVVNDYLGKEADDSFTVDVKHVDGSLNALQKKNALDWLANDMEDNHARVLSNVRFLTEGIDVPSLDAVIFFSPKKSQVDIVQAVGRIMRRYEGKDYGYIILPVVIDAGAKPEDVLDNNKRYREVWQVLNALRSTDERFEAEINKLQLNKKKSGKINFIGTDTSPSKPVTEERGKEAESVQEEPATYQTSLALKWGEIEQAFYGRVVQKVGDRRYLEDWSSDVANIAHKHIQRINDLIDSNVEAKQAFDSFLKSLHYNINDGIDRDQAVQMLAQHLITQPVFEALFAGYSFVKDNPVSQAINSVVAVFEKYGFDNGQQSLKPFYDSVKARAQGIDNAAAKQRIIKTLYENFFRKGFEKTTDAMGIVFTPVEVVDFIIHSVDDALQKYFGKRLSDQNVHVLDPFTGTGTFITRTLQYFKQEMDAGKITYQDILRKYMHELHANEIVLLSYYIAAINIEAVFDEVNGPDEGYMPFDGIVLTDTFESTERNSSFMDELFGQNNERLKKQQETPITAIISNPPYSVGQGNANDNNQNTHYPMLEKRMQNTYSTNATLTRGTYDSYVKALRWASDRIGNQGVIGFVTNGSFIDSQSTDGVRKALYKEFNHLYIFNLRGNQRTKGEKSRQEGGKIFGSGSRAPIAISILIKDNSDNHELFYHDIGNYLSRKEKLELIQSFGSITNIPWKKLLPDINSDWINPRDPNYQKFPSISGEAKSPFYENAPGINTNRDGWAVSFSKHNLYTNMERMIANYNQSLDEKKDDKNVDNVKWSAGLRRTYRKGEKITFNPNHIVLSLYRPFAKKWLYFDRKLTERPGKYIKQWGNHNIVILTSGRGSSRFSSLVSGLIPNLNCLTATQGFMMYNNTESSNELIKQNKDNITTYFSKKIGLTKDDTFAYIYGLLNSKEYRDKYANDLKKDLARIPVVKDKDKYVEIGKKLIDLHLNYEKVEPYDDVNITVKGEPNYRVKKMKFAKKLNSDTGKREKDYSTIIFNDTITISNIPLKAYSYIIDDKSAIEWIMDQYQVKTDKKSGITDDPNDYSDDQKYIFNLLLRIINVSIQTVDLVNKLPDLTID
ncbi:DEAD/DEAH box helicase family protein [Limosilactobacillus reuteri]|uniref:type ISP restriction/modification enzyme n=1 Tax=Limosilactobacillus reuteri TaxID=1598 RepID=UPI001E58B0C2|nr:type ISP restriction/modification enzyme [Limosilactobacillus reuteri]MCC4325219.1 DEAD/DEAH box helicase family protein [Limosilactobacillus reuteri]MCC4328938.1 DEAD/DEAH box helicase family protein [Limosilactobacillus reuteri]